MTKINKRNIGIVAVIVSAICFGLVPMLVKILNQEGATTLMSVFYRFALSLLPLYLYLKVKKIPLKISGQQFGRICLVTIMGYAGTSFLLFFSYNLIPTGMATTIHFIYPVVVIFYSLVFLREKVRPVKLLCVALSMAGIIMFHDGEAGGQTLGIIIALASGFTYGFYILYLERSQLKTIPPLKLIFYMNAVATVVAMVMALLTGQFTLELTPYGWAVGVAFAVTVSFVAVLGFQLGIKYVDGQSAAILSTFEPITSVVVGVIVYDEGFGLKTLAGCLLVLTAAVIIGKTKENVTQKPLDS